MLREKNPQIVHCLKDGGVDGKADGIMCPYEMAPELKLELKGSSSSFDNGTGDTL